MQFFPTFRIFCRDNTVAEYSVFLIGERSKFSVKKKRLADRTLIKPTHKTEKSCIIIVYVLPDSQLNKIY
jgi:hypothetical protein